MKVVIDANIYVSSLLSSTKGNPAKIIQHWQQGHIELCASDPILDEIDRVLRYPKLTKLHKQSAEQITQYISDLRRLVTIVAPTETLTVSIDESDNRYIECAIKAKAPYLVTGDKKHLLPIREYQSVRITDPKTFLDLLDLHLE